MFEVRFSGDGQKRYPMISFNKLEECVEKLVTCVEKALQKFRKILPPGIIEKYEKNTASFTITNGGAGGASNENVNSLYYIKEHLCDRIIKDKYKLGLSSGNHALKNIWLYLTNATNQSVHETGIFNLLYWTKQNQTATPGTPVSTIEKRSLKENYIRFPINRIGIHAPNTFTGDSISLIGKVMMENSTTTSLRSIHPLILPILDPNVAGSDLITTIMKEKHMGYHGIYDYTEYDNNGDKWEEDDLKSGSFNAKGLILKFNNLLYNYIQMFTEKQSTKIYLPLLQQFSNALSSEVMQGNGLNDIDENTDTNGPKLLESDKITKNMGTYILCKTMGAAIRSIVTNKKNTSSVSILTFAEDNLVNVPEYMKDTMIAYLPIYDKHLNIISSQAEFIKTCLESSKITITDDITAANNMSKGIFINVCDNLIRGCRALQSCINSVSTELSDIPLYFETYKNSIADYKNRNGHLPFMPLSHASHLLNNQIRLSDDNDNGIKADTEYTPIMGGSGNKFGGSIAEETKKFNALYKMYDDYIQEKDLHVSTPFTYTERLKEFKTGIETQKRNVINEYTNAGLPIDPTFETESTKKIKEIINELNMDRSTLEPQANNKYIKDLGDKINTMKTTTIPNKKIDITAFLNDAKNVIIVNRIPLKYTDTSDDAGLSLNTLIDPTNIQTLDDNITTAKNVYNKAYGIELDRLNTIAKNAGNKHDTAQIIADVITSVVGQKQNWDDEIEEKTNNGEEVSLLNGYIILRNELEAFEAKLNAMESLIATMVVTSGPELDTLYQIYKLIGFGETNRSDIAEAKDLIADLQTTSGENKKEIGTLQTSFKALESLKLKENKDLTLKSAPVVTTTTPVATPTLKSGNLAKHKYYNNKGLVPNHTISNGSEAFIYAYGMRGIVSDNIEPNIKLAPGINNTLDIFNSKPQGVNGGAFDSKLVNDCFVSSVYLLRYCTDYIYHKTHLIDNDLDKTTMHYIIARKDYTDKDKKPAVNKYVNVLSNLACQTG
jgi:hypothetical protein